MKLAAQKSITRTANPLRVACPCRRTARPARRSIATHAIDDTNFFVNFIASGVAGAAVTAVVTVTSQDRDLEIQRLQTPEGLLPIGAAVVADSIAHSIPGLNILFGLLSEPAGAAAGVAYLMTLVLSSPAVDPTTLAPEGTIINAKTAQDSRAAIRVPFTQIVPTALKVIDTKNEFSSGKGWTVGEDGLPRLPINSVLIVLGVGALVVEATSHAPLLGFLMPRVLQVACWVALAGAVLDKRQ